jgi:Cof subfamily protein (haloacid dehalogenase superfamily)
MEKKLIAIDLDGTLLNDKMTLTSFSCQILQELLEKGHLVVLASGRPLRALYPFYEAIGSTCPVIAYNGMLVTNPQDPSFPELKRTFPQEAIRAIALASHGLVTSMVSEGEKMVYLQKEDAYLEKYFPHRFYPHVIGPLEMTLREDPFTAVFKTTHPKAQALERLVEGQAGIKLRPWSKSFYSEAYYPEVSKGSALAYLEKELGIPPEDVYAFGDSENDREMLLEAGHPYAVFHCKSHALSRDFPVTEKSNDHDGVALTLQRLLLKP